MVAQPQSRAADAVIYPESDGRPMADNTQQFRWIVTIKENLEILFADNPNVFVAGDLLWYPVDGFLHLWSYLRRGIKSGNGRIKSINGQSD